MCTLVRVCRTPTLNPVNQLLAPPTLAPYSLYSISLRGLRPNYFPPTFLRRERRNSSLSRPSKSADRSLLRYLLRFFCSPFYCFLFFRAARIKGLLGNISKGGLMRQRQTPNPSALRVSSGMHK